MNELMDLVKILVPAATVLLGMFFTVKAFLNKEFEKKKLDLIQKNQEIILPIRLQAYERFCLLIERLSAQNLLMRLNEPGILSAELQERLLISVREEFNHNLSQQLYISDKAWKKVCEAKEDVLAIINTAAKKIDPTSRSIDLAKAIIEESLSRQDNACASALSALKGDIKVLF